MFVWNGFGSNGFSGLSHRRDPKPPMLDVVSIMSRDQRVINAPDFRGEQMTSVMGRSELDLRKTTDCAGRGRDNRSLHADGRRDDPGP